jgi:glyoxylase-like metal-dependent hydrolase (beta-lactamase superfamily II)
MTEVDFRTAAPVAANWDVKWMHGAPRKRAATEPPIQIHRHDAHSYILRQSKTQSFEAPFIYLLFGNDRAMLLDTGATEDAVTFPLRATVDGLIAQWLAEHPRPSYPLVVAHTHGHGDHVAADPQFADRPHTVVVGRPAADVLSYFGLVATPFEPTPFDLGGRVLEVFAIPGHHAASVAVHDPWTGWLLTGDTVYPGRLYVAEFPEFVASLDRLVAFANARPGDARPRLPHRDDNHPAPGLSARREIPTERTAAADERGAVGGGSGRRACRRRLAGCTPVRRLHHLQRPVHRRAAAPGRAGDGPPGQIARGARLFAMNARLRSRLGGRA